MSVEETTALLLLNRLTEASPKLGVDVGAHYQSAEHLLEAYDETKIPLPPKMRARFKAPIEHQVRLKVDQDLRWLAEPYHHLVSYFDADYPAMLRHIPDPPLCLYGIGDINLLNQSQIAIVGSRRPTQVGARIAAHFAAELASIGLVITSGLAYGIDACAHRGCLKQGGKTIAVLGCGVDLVYPRQHERLCLNISKQGLVLSEFPLGTGAHARFFPQRNRVVTGLSFGTLVVEAALKSGTLISARLAMEFGREVFAVPGSIYSEQSAGCHRLIKNGAKLVQSIEDIIDEMPDAAVPRALDARAQLCDEEKCILSHLSGQTTTIDELCDLTKIAIPALLSHVIKLEIDGFVMEQGLGIVLAKPL